MRLTDEEKAMLAGDMGSHMQWAIDHQIKIGNFFDADDMVPVSQAHMMADPESFGDAGAAFMETIAKDGSKVVIPMITDPRGVDLSYYRPWPRPRRWPASSVVLSLPRVDWHHDDQYLHQLSDNHATSFR